MDFEWYGSDDECHENSESGSCLEGIIDYVDAQDCYYQSRYNVCEDMDQCIAVVEIDGQYYPGKCEELAEMFGVPYGEDDDEEEETEDETVEEDDEWMSCMDMYVDVPDVTRCWYKEDEDSCYAVGTYMDQTLFGTCDDLIAAAEMGDLTFYGNSDECIEEEQASCMDDPDIAAIADFCYYTYSYDICNDVEVQCLGVVEVDGTDYIDTCENLSTIFLGGEDYEPEDDTEETTEEDTTEETTEETTDENADDATEELLQELKGSGRGL